MSVVHGIFTVSKIFRDEAPALFAQGMPDSVVFSNCVVLPDYPLSNPLEMGITENKYKVSLLFCPKSKKNDENYDLMILSHPPWYRCLSSDKNNPLPEQVREIVVSHGGTVWVTPKEVQRSKDC